MKRTGWLIATVALWLCVPALTQCVPVQPGLAATDAFDALARRVPADAREVSFLDLEPQGEAGRHWRRIRGQLEANPAGREMIHAMYADFQVEEYGLGDLIAGPAVKWYDSRSAVHIIAPVNDERATEEAMLHHFGDVQWEQARHGGSLVYHGRLRESTHRDRLAWTVHDGLLFLAQNYSQDALPYLEEVLDRAEEDSVAALASWQSLRAGLPESPMVLLFYNIPGQAGSSPPPSENTSLSTALSRQPGAIACAAVPEAGGVRVEILGAWELQPDAPPQLHALFGLPAVDATAWDGLPANTAFALIGHDMSLVWSLLDDILNLDSLVQLSELIHLDIQGDLASPDGPLADDFALALTPPLPAQPIMQDIPAAQLLILAPDAREAQMAEVQARMADRGAVFGSREVEGVALQTQVGTELTGYAISYGLEQSAGFDEGTLLFGTSPNVIAQGASARRAGSGLVTRDAFRDALETLPADPALVAYADAGLVTTLVKANVGDDEYRQRSDYVLFEAFDAFALGLRFTPDGRVDGTAYLFVGR